jgi:hypothetical protein
MNRMILLTPAILPAAMLLLAGCGGRRDNGLTQLAAQQAAVTHEMANLNREVAQGLGKLTQENAEFRKEALAMQKQLHDQRVELIQKQEALDKKRRRLEQHDPLVAKAVTHVGITLACLLPLWLCWHLLREPADQELDPVVNDLLLHDLVSERPRLVAPMTVPGPPPLPLPYRGGTGGEGGERLGLPEPAA